MTKDHREVLAAARVSAAVEAVLQLFQAELSGVEFPDLNQARLDEYLEQVVAAHSTVEAAKTALLAREAELLKAKEALTRACERGLAYARVFASEDEHLLSAVAAIPAFDAVATAAPRSRKPRGPRKHASAPSNESGVVPAEKTETEAAE